MLIVYDFEVTKTDVAFSDKGYKMLDTMRDFVNQRLNVLREEIELQNGYILINVLNTMKHINPDIPNGISYSNVSDDLESKMESCFDINDLEYLESLLLSIKSDL